MGPSRDLNSGMRCVKYLLFTFNLLFVITGILMITIGATINAVYLDYIDFLEDRYLSPAALIIAVGCIIFFVAFFGCCGAIRESTCMVFLFAVMLGIIFVLELSAGIAGYVLQDGLKEMLLHRINHTMHNYETNAEMAQTVDYLQEQLNCCGLKSFDDWDGILTPDDNVQNPTEEGILLPNSCCAEYYTDSETCSKIYGNGCLYRLEFLIGQCTVLLGSAAICLALLQLLGVTFACSLGKSIRFHKTERERRRQELQEQLISSYSLLGSSDPKKMYPMVYKNQSQEKTYTI